MAVFPTPASPNKYRVVFGASAQDLSRAFDFVLATDHKGPARPSSPTRSDRGTNAQGRLFEIFLFALAEGTAA